MAILRGQQLETRLSGSYIISGSTQELIATDSITLTGNVTASGVVKADAFESVAGGTAITFNDDITIDGDVSSSSTKTGSFGRAEIAGTGTFDKIGINVSNPSEALEIDAGKLKFSGNASGFGAGMIGMTSNTLVFVGGSNGININGDSTGQDENSFTFTSAKVSGSSISTGSFGDGRFASKVGIGLDKLIYGNETPHSYLDVRGNNVTPSNGNGSYHTMQLVDTTTMAEGVGGGIAFGGKFVGNTDTLFGEIRGLKENGTSNNYAGALTFQTRANGANLTEQVRIDSSGNLAVGTSSPSAKLHVVGDGLLTGDLTVGGKVTAEEFHTEFVSSSIVFVSGSTKFGDTQDDIHNFTGSFRQSGSGQDHYFLTGNVGIGSTSPARKLEIKDTSSNVGIRLTTGTALDAIIDLGDTGDADIGQIRYDNNTDKMHFRTNANDRVTIDSSGRVGIGTSSPSDSLTIVGSVSASESGSFRDLVNTGDMFSTHLTGSFSGSFHGQAGARHVHSQATAASTWSITHALGVKYPNVTVYDGNDQMVIPTSVTATNANQSVLTFSHPISGIAMFGVGGMSSVSGRTFIHSQGTAGTNWYVTHSLGEQFPAVTVYDDTNSVIIPERILAVSPSTMELTFQDNTSGNAHFSVGNGLPGVNSANAGKFMRVAPHGNHIEYVTTFFDVTGSLEITGSITLTGSGSISGSSISTGSFGHLIVDGNVSASGVVSADAFESRTAGDSVNFADSVNVVGSVTASGAIDAAGGISGSATSTGSFGRVEASTYVGVDSFSDGTATLISGSSTSTGSFGRVIANSMLVDSGSFLVSGSTHTADTANVETSLVKIKQHGLAPSLFIEGGKDANLRLRSGQFRSGIFIDEPGTNTTMGSVLVLPDDNTFRLGTQSHYHMIMYNDTGLTSILSDGVDAIVLDTDQNAAFAGNVSGSSTSTGSFGRVEASTYAGVDSFSDGTATLISGSAIGTGSFGSLKLNNEFGDVNIRSTSGTAMNVVIGDSTTGESLNSGAQGNVLIGQGISAPAGASNNVFIGDGAGQANAASNNNVAIGFSAMGQGNSNARTVAIGFRALNGSGNSNNNVAVGVQAGEATTDGEENIFFGYDAGDTNTTGDQNVALGSRADVSTANAQNQIAIGYNVTSTGDNQTVIGNSDQTHVVFGGDALISGSALSTGSFADGRFVNKVKIGLDSTTSSAGLLHINQNFDGVVDALHLSNNLAADSGLNEAVQISFGLAPGYTEAAMIRVLKAEDYTSSGARSSNLAFHLQNNGSTSEVMRFRRHFGLGILNTGKLTEALTVEGNISASGDLMGVSNVTGSATSTGSFGSLSLGESTHIHTLSIKGQSEGSTGIRVRHPSDDTLFEVIASEDDGRLRLFANNSRKIQLHANDVSYFNGGDVGIGTESPQKDLHLHQNNSNTLFEALTIRTNTAGEGLTLGINSTNDGFITSQVGTALRLAGDSQSYATGHLLIYSGSGNIEAVKGNISGSATSTGSIAVLNIGGTGTTDGGTIFRAGETQVAAGANVGDAGARYVFNVDTAFPYVGVGIMAQNHNPHHLAILNSSFRSDGNFNYAFTLNQNNSGQAEIYVNADRVLNIDGDGNQTFGQTSGTKYAHISGSSTTSGSFGRVDVGSKLFVNSTQMNVPDYVFESDYKLKTISNLETHISQSKHLPGVPSRDELELWTSYDMANRDMLLLEKIEELTLYTIQLNKRIEELERNSE